MIYETKGTYLDNPDTEYKKKVFEKLEDAFNCGTVTVQGHRLRGKFQIVFEDRFHTSLLYRNKVSVSRSLLIRACRQVDADCS